MVSWPCLPVGGTRAAPSLCSVPLRGCKMKGFWSLLVVRVPGSLGEVVLAGAVTWRLLLRPRHRCALQLRSSQALISLLDCGRRDRGRAEGNLFCPSVCLDVLFVRRIREPSPGPRALTRVCLAFHGASSFGT